MPDRAGARLIRVFLLLMALPLLAAGCAPAGPWADDETVARALHANPGPPELTLFTVVNNRTGHGDHSSLLISGSHRILYDPAGTWYDPNAPQRNDVHYGISPRIEQRYVQYHARDTHHVIAQTVRLTEAQAARAMSAVPGLSPAAPGACAIRTSGILRQVPGFESLPATVWPRTLRDAFGQKPGVTNRRIDPIAAPAMTPVPQG